MIRTLMIAFAILGIVVSTVGCAPAAGTLRNDALDIKVSYKLDSRILGPTYGGELWVSPPIYDILGDGDTYVMEAGAEVLDNNGQPLQVHFEWIPEDPEMVTVSPSQGDLVTITIQLAGESSLVVKTAQGLSKTLNITATYQNNVIRVKISQVDESG